MPVFAFPWAFLALTATGALTAVYLLRNRYRRRAVSSLMLWQAFCKPREGGARWQRLQTPWLFLLEMFILVCLTLAATDPHILLAGRRPLVVVLDDSYSMTAAPPDGDSPRQRAVEALSKLLDRTDGTSVQFMLAGPRPRLLGQASTAARAASLLAQWQPGSAWADLDRAVRLAGQIAPPRARLLVVTDHRPSIEPLPDRLQWWAFGQRLGNLAITTATRTGRGPADRVMFVLANLADRPARVSVSLTLADDRQVLKQPLDLGPGQTHRIATDLPPDAGALTARIEPDDALAIDNQVVLLPPPRLSVRVGLKVADESLRQALLKVLEACRQCRLVTDRPDLLITDHAALPAAGSRCWLLQILGRADSQPATSYAGPYLMDNTHPLLEGMDLRQVIWSVAGGEAPSPGGRPLVMVGDQVLLSETVLPSQRRLLRLRLLHERSTLAQTPNWPVLFWNLLDWQGRYLPGLRENNLRLGRQALLRIDPSDAPVNLVEPDGRRTALPFHRDQVVFQPQHVGVYRLEGARRAWALAVNALSYAESDLTGCRRGRWGSWVGDVSASPSYRSAAWVLLGLALAMLSLHTWLVARMGGGT